MLSPPPSIAHTPEPSVASSLMAIRSHEPRERSVCDLPVASTSSITLLALSPVVCAKTVTCWLSLVTCTPRCIGICSTHSMLPSVTLIAPTYEVYVPYMEVICLPPIVLVPLKLPATTSVDESVDTST